MDTTNTRIRRWPACLWAILACLLVTASCKAQTNTDVTLPISICKDQSYALCSGRSCFTYNSVAYCTCDVLNGNSISQSLAYGPVGDQTSVCQINAAGPPNGYVVSTFSLRPSLINPTGNQALYTCPRTSTVSYAKCDGAICFTSPSGKSFVGSPVGGSQVICTCPITQANLLTGVQFIGPYPCQKSFFDVCSSSVNSNTNGGTVYSASPIGSEALNNLLLTGTLPVLNQCTE
jgi:hypothetical protein